VRVADRTASIARWTVEDPFGYASKQEMKALGNKRFEIRPTKPVPQMLFAFASSGPSGWRKHRRRSR
jgi:hypothetical protein